MPRPLLAIPRPQPVIMHPCAVPRDVVSTCQAVGCAGHQHNLFHTQRCPFRPTRGGPLPQPCDLPCAASACRLRLLTPPAHPAGRACTASPLLEHARGPCGGLRDEKDSSLARSHRRGHRWRREARARCSSAPAGPAAPAELVRHRRRPPCSRTTRASWNRSCTATWTAQRTGSPHTECDPSGEAAAADEERAGTAADTRQRSASVSSSSELTYFGVRVGS